MGVFKQIFPMRMSFHAQLLSQCGQSVVSTQAANCMTEQTPSMMKIRKNSPTYPVVTSFRQKLKAFERTLQSSREMPLEVVLPSSLPPCGGFLGRTEHLEIPHAGGAGGMDEWRWVQWTNFTLQVLLLVGVKNNTKMGNMDDDYCNKCNNTAGAFLPSILDCSFLSPFLERSNPKCWGGVA